MTNKKVLTLIFIVAFVTLLVGCLPQPTNQIPIITSSPITTAKIGMLYAYDVNATDPDGDVLTYSFIDRPEGMVINSTTGVINWIPSLSQIGDNPVVVKVSDGFLSIAQSFIIEVSKFPIYQAPIIYSVPITTVTVGATYVYDVEATDPDGDVLTYSITTKPAGMTINSVTGLIWWIPTLAQVGFQEVTVMVTDGVLIDTQGFTIVVSKPTPTPIEPELTEITVLPKTMDLILGGFETFEVTAHYDNDTTKIVTFKCNYLSSNYNIAYVAYGFDKVITFDVGTATIFISYKEGDITKTDEIEVTVTQPMEIIADLPTFKAGEETEFTIDVVANSDVNKNVMFYFKLPVGLVYDTDYILEILYKGVWYDLLTRGVTIYDEDTGEYALGGETGDPLINETRIFKGTFNEVGTYTTVVEVRTYPGDIPLCSKDISANVVE